MLTNILQILIHQNIKKFYLPQKSQQISIIHLTINIRQKDTRTNSRDILTTLQHILCLSTTQYMYIIWVYQNFLLNLTQETCKLIWEIISSQFYSINYYCTLSKKGKISQFKPSKFPTSIDFNTRSKIIYFLKGYGIIHRQFL
eukprot:EC096733.1.p2 GENE.EC096733.1~~EC096733.1.p2  ORF type:complete len:143 (-),score=1.49 EC096733.1:199-627(-)